ncbi:hypothetical protein NDI54_03875 [Haloarcula sp. S1AR25-5A]|uniref:Uncharacterized protein n=1 Tax=Haloarcula terrestris TaxID=2950533 RepID=A0AAE4EX98_9EURY|nr:hypothetical protein [Haloarcula terrestris]MDS0220486.1 hypothetical protein [Haloarcula terrestris]
MSNVRTIIRSVAIALLIISAGCSAFAGGSGPTEEKATSTLTPEPTSEVTETPTSVATETESDPIDTEEPETETESATEGELSKVKKFEKFDEEMEYLSRDDASVEGEAFPENDSYHLTYEMRDTTNRTKTVNDRLDPLWTYYVIVEEYNNNDEQDHTYIPDTVNVTFTTEDGGVFETTHIKYIWAYKYYTDEWSLRIFMAKYGSTTEEGPAYHDNWR